LSGKRAGLKYFAFEAVFTRKKSKEKKPQLLSVNGMVVDERRAVGTIWYKEIIKGVMVIDELKRDEW
jgi:hypothetical protein